MHQNIRVAFSRRYKRIVEQAENLKIKPPDKDGLWLKLLHSYMGGFTCEYCGEELKVSDPPTNFRVFSFDHRLPVTRGGDNTRENIAIICHRCNIIKGTMSDTTYLRFIKVIKETQGLEFLNLMAKEMFPGRLANQIERRQHAPIDYLPEQIQAMGLCNNSNTISQQKTQHPMGRIPEKKAR